MSRIRRRIERMTDAVTHRGVALGPYDIEVDEGLREGCSGEGSMAEGQFGAVEWARSS